MADASYDIREERFVIDPEITHVYIFLEAHGDCPIGVQGWHYKAFPASIPVIDIIGKHMWLGTGEDDDPVLWPQKAPGESR